MRDLLDGKMYELCRVGEEDDGSITVAWDMIRVSFTRADFIEVSNAFAHAAEVLGRDIQGEVDRYINDLAARRAEVVK